MGAKVKGGNTERPPGNVKRPGQMSRAGCRQRHRNERSLVIKTGRCFDQPRNGVSCSSRRCEQAIRRMIATQQRCRDEERQHRLLIVMHSWGARKDPADRSRGNDTVDPPTVRGVKIHRSWADHLPFMT